MKIQFLVLSVALTTLSVAASGQCPKAGTKPIWDSAKDEFRCADPSANESAQSAIVPPIGDKARCKIIREDLQSACPSPDEGKACKNTAKSLFEACYKDSERSNSAPGVPSSPANRTDASTCMTTYQQQQQTCRTRTVPPRVPGQPYVPDTCMSDALAAQNKCLANSR